MKIIHDPRMYFPSLQYKKTSNLKGLLVFLKFFY
jgi:hypothetical protein